jgi:pseudaminic acid cytidylyltransferase
VRVAVIPARGGSKRIPRKNIRPFAGRPMIAHSIEAASQSGLFDRILVSTDDDEIADVARACGAEAPFRRPADISDDRSGTTEVVAHAVQWLQQQGAAPQAVCCIYATAPFLQQDDLKAGLELLDSGGWQYVFAATNFAAPVQRAFQRDGRGGLTMLFPEHFATRSQDLPEALHDAGQFYWGLPGAWLKRLRVFDAHSSVVLLPRWRVQDIDTEEDWIRAEWLASYLDRSHQQQETFS